LRAYAAERPAQHGSINAELYKGCSVREGSQVFEYVSVGGDGLEIIGIAAEPQSRTDIS
jgi:hypothetical protein